MDLINEWVNLISQTYLIPQHTRDSSKLYKHCQDNCVVVVGKIIKTFSNSFPIQHLCKGWIQKLPLKTDKVEGPLQIGFLIDILSSNPEFVISNAEDLTEVLIVFANYIKIMVKKINEEKNVASLKRVKEILQQLGGCNLFFGNAE